MCYWTDSAYKIPKIYVAEFLFVWNELNFSIVLILCSQSSRWAVHWEITKISSHKLCGRKKRLSHILLIQLWTVYHEINVWTIMIKNFCHIQFNQIVRERKTRNENMSIFVIWETWAKWFLKFSSKSNESILLCF